jgi:capsular polysaccharide biosynthesis protein/GGDEF domain-containing protein
MEIKFYLRIIQRGWWMILISALVAVNLSLVYSYYFTTPMYESVARFIVSPNLKNIDFGDLINSLQALDKRSIISTYAEILNSRQIINGTMDLLLAKPDEFIAYTTSVTVLPDANIIRFSVKGPDPQVSAMLANSIGQYAINYVKKLYVVYDIDFLDKAVAALEPYQPQPLQDAGLALLVGLVIGVGLAIFRDQLSSSLDKLGQRNMLDSESLAYSRTHFERLIRQEITDNPKSVLTLGIIQLNGIEEYYDSLPQAYINKIMRKVTETLKFQLRGNDVVGRWSQLQFSILLPSTDGISAKRRLARISDILGEQISLEAKGEFDIRLDPRIGLADRQGDEYIPVLVVRAEEALEVSMQSAKEKVYLYKIHPFG